MPDTTNPYIFVVTCQTSSGKSAFYTIKIIVDDWCTNANLVDPDFGQPLSPITYSYKSSTTYKVSYSANPVLCTSIVYICSSSTSPDLCAYTQNVPDGSYNGPITTFDSNTGLWSIFEDYIYEGQTMQLIPPQKYILNI